MGEFRMPSLGADMERGVLIEWLVKAGDPVRRGDVIAVVETPKSAVEVECFETGTVQQLLVDEGQTVPVGAALAILGEGAAEGVAAVQPVVAPEPSEAKAAPEKAAQPQKAPKRQKVLKGAKTAKAGMPAKAPKQLVHDGAVAGVRRPWISPLARRLAAEAGIDISRLTGTGLGGAIRADDVRRAGAAQPMTGARPETVAAAQPTAVVESALAGKPASVTQSRSETDRAADMRQSIAALMTVSNREIPHYHLTLTVDLQRSLLWMKERNRELDMSERLVPAALMLAAAARAARAVPDLNGHWVDGAFHPAKDVDLGLILSLRTGGLLVPAIAGADRLSVDETMRSIKELTRRARAGRLRGSDLVQPSITVSNLGDQGVDTVLGVIYPPQVALVGFGTVADRPWAVDGLIGVRPLVTVSLAGDHRATDGATGSRFLKTIDRLLQSPEEL